MRLSSSIFFAQVTGTNAPGMWANRSFHTTASAYRRKKAVFSTGTLYERRVFRLVLF
ncbi:hypothetical protein CLOSTMETH_01037 [[Clostridium] methylpentosum DSM 5476]|uniref:Uncharacterized protein n=1 Tax=[Clostridium] methylpentosum DSM 5476 TaxID=537013 RepID=C0EB20_9FIRM|nr:hypothetical protein CLOSTMETH_01037 [[Clostridium] methylpentosum DSM 5476]